MSPRPGAPSPLTCHRQTVALPRLQGPGWALRWLQGLHLWASPSTLSWLHPQVLLVLSGHPGHVWLPAPLWGREGEKGLGSVMRASGSLNIRPLAQTCSVFLYPQLSFSKARKEREEEMQGREAIFDEHLKASS